MSFVILDVSRANVTSFTPHVSRGNIFLTVGDVCGVYDMRVKR